MADEKFKDIAIFKTDDESINVEVIFEDETAWLALDRLAAFVWKISFGDQ